MGDVIAAVGVAQEGFAAVAHPFHRPPHPLGGPQRHHLLRIDENLGAEAAAHVGRDHAQFVLGRQPHEGGDDQARHMRVLAGGPQGEAVAAGIVVADRGTRLHGVGHQPVVDDVEPGHVLGRLEGGLDRAGVAQVPLIDGVGGRHLVNLRRALVLRLGGIGDRRQHLVIANDLLGGIPGLRQGIRHHHRDRVPHMAGLAGRERGMRRHLHRGAILGMDEPAADEVADLVGRELSSGEHRQNARHRGGGLGVDLLDAGVGMRRAHEIGMRLARLLDIGGVVTFAGDETLVFLAAHRRADPGRAHGGLLRGQRRAARRAAPTRRLVSRRLAHRPWRGRRPRWL